MTERILPQKRSANHRDDPPSSSSSQRYTKLLSVLTKSLQQSRDKIESNAAPLIKEIYGDMTSLFTTGDDDDNGSDGGVTQLVDLLLGKLDTVYDRFTVDKSEVVNNNNNNNNSMTKLESILEQQQIQQLLHRVESAIARVDMDELNFQQEEAADKLSAEEAVQKAHTLRRTTVAVENTASSGGGEDAATEGKLKLKLRKMSAEQFVGYHSHKMKEEYLESLQKELEEVSRENEEMEGVLKERWEEWQTNLGEVKDVLGMMQQLGSEEEDEEEEEVVGPRDP